MPKFWSGENALPAVAVALLLALSACDAELEIEECGSGQMCPPAARELPAPERDDYEPEETRTGRIRLEPISSSVEEDVEYRFSIHVHCGLDVAVVDFDGSFWDFIGPGSGDDGSSNPVDGFADPSDEGTMVLVSEKRAEYESSMGAPAHFERHEGSKVFETCE